MSRILIILILGIVVSLGQLWLPEISTGQNLLTRRQTFNKIMLNLGRKTILTQNNQLNRVNNLNFPYQGYGSVSYHRFLTDIIALGIGYEASRGNFAYDLEKIEASSDPNFEPIKLITFTTRGAYLDLEFSYPFKNIIADGAFSGQALSAGFGFALGYHILTVAMETDKKEYFDETGGYGYKGYSFLDMGGESFGIRLAISYLDYVFTNGLDLIEEHKAEVVSESQSSYLFTLGLRYSF